MEIFGCSTNFNLNYFNQFLYEINAEKNGQNQNPKLGNLCLRIFVRKRVWDNPVWKLGL